MFRNFPTLIYPKNIRGIVLELNQEKNSEELEELKLLLKLKKYYCRKLRNFYQAYGFCIDTYRQESICMCKKKFVGGGLQRSIYTGMIFVSLGREVFKGDSNVRWFICSVDPI
jgi:hypothetical protein